MRTAHEVASAALERLVKDPTARWNPVQRQDLTAIQDQLKNISRLAEAIVPLVAPAAPVANPRANLAEVARQAGNRFQHFAQQNNQTLVCDVQPESLIVEADPAQLTQVLHGLLSNAIKYSPQGGHVTLQLERTAEGLAHIMVADTGFGIDPALVSHIFDSNYHSQESRPRRFGGLGIGLSLVKEIITSQKGKIWVESKPGSGTRIHFTLPVVR